MRIKLATGNSVDSYTGDGTSGIFIWGAMLNIGSTAGLYVQTVASAYYAPRFDYNPSTLAAQGLLIEEQRTNSIRNNTMQGAVAGTPGTLPTNWAIFTSLTGLTQTIVGTGVENGVTYIEIRLNGTPSAAGTYQWYTEAANGVPATVGQTWTLSQFFKLQAGSLSGVNLVRHFFEERSSAGSYLTEQSITAPNPTSASLSSQRSSATRTTTDPACAFLRSGFNLSLSGAAIDITLRIGLPQLELGAFATSVIPTTTTALTRNADVASVNTLTPWFNAVEGTLFAEFAVAGYAPSGTFPSIAALSDNTGNNRVSLASTNTGANLYSFGEVNAGGVSQAGFYGASGSPFGVGSVRKSAIAYAANNFAFTVQGLAAQTDTSGTVPTVSGLKLAADATGSAFFLNGYLRRITYYPRRLPNSTLQALTA
jgi:hypothetical protein